MIKLKGTLRGREVIVLALSHANLDRLRADGLKGYIQVDGADLGIGCDILITAAETEAVMFESFLECIGPNTKLHISDKLQ